MIAIDTPLTLAYLKGMVRIDSVNPGLVSGGAGEGEVAAWLHRTCRELGLDVQVQESAPGRPNVLACWPGSGRGKSLLLTGHTDVVGTENMVGDPFDARVENGRLYGRGALDMKGGLAAILSAVAALRSDGFHPAGDIWLGFVTDEEYLSVGMDALVQQIHTDAAILTEPTGMDICIAHKGFAWLTITTHGKAAHGSLYDTGVDAISHMGRVLNILDHFERETFPARQHDLLGRSSAHASTISGGLGLSTYPDRCTLQVEHRLLPDMTPDDLLSLWQKALAEITAANPQFQAEVKLDFARPGYEISRNAPVVQTLRHAYQSVMGTEPNYGGMYAWLDSAILADAGIPTVILGPGGEGMHAAVEYVRLEDVYRCAAVLAQTAALWTGA